MDRIEIDFEKYAVLENTELKKHWAFEKSNSERINTLYLQYSGFSKIPEYEEITCHPIVSNGICLVVNEAISSSITINTLNFNYTNVVPASCSIINVDEAIELLKSLYKA